MRRAEIIEPSRQTALFGEYEVVVLGGGPAGIAAALAAGRSGRSTLLIERYGFLGGAGTAAGLSTFCGLHAVVHGKHEQVVHGIADDILERLRAMDGLNKPHLTIRDQILAQAYDISAFKIAADELLFEMDIDGVPDHEAIGDLGVGHEIGRSQRRQRLVREDNAPAVGGARRIALEDGDVPCGAHLLQEQARVETTRPAAKDVHFQPIASLHQVSFSCLRVSTPCVGRDSAQSLRIARSIS